MADPTTVAGLNAWFKADAITGLVDGDPVATWPESQSAANATQGTAAKKPVYKTAQVNSLPAVRFDGVDDVMTSTASSSLTATTVFVVAKVTAATVGRALRGAGNDGGLEFRINATDFQQVVRQNVADVSSSTSTVTEDAWQSWTTSFANASTYAFYAGGTANGTGTHAVTLTAAQTTALGAGLTGGAGFDFMVGDIAEIIVYDSVLSAGDRATVHTYIQDKYGITVSDYAGAPRVTYQHAVQIG